ncbi:MAG: 4-hydroxy-tetrahydrodipicolinate synthase [Bacteroidetes bacterium]|nr:4-hydroxy-tetrahydrodipicolinate synthase [Bacteroidota bacterium]
MRGTGVALITPFNEDFSIDFDSLGKIIDHCISGGVDYLVALGTTGETATLSKAEKEQVYRFVVDKAAGRVACVAGIGGNHTAEILATLSDFNFDGYDAILSVSPYYNKPNQEGIYLHYKAIADASPVPVILYNVPGRTGSNMLVSTTLKLAAHPNIIAIKEASGNSEQFMDILQGAPDSFLVISGDDNLTLPFLAMGMSGVISVIGQAYPAQFSTMVRLGLEGRFEEARQLHYQLYSMMKAIFLDGNPGGIKAVMSMMGLCKNVVRLPLAPVKSEVYQQLETLYKELR